MNKVLTKTLGSILLIGGTAIGAGMLALPTSTAQIGFYPSLILFGICWFFSTLAALFLLEVHLWGDEKNDLLSMVESTLGTTGKWIAALLYLGLLYSLISAYLRAGHGWFSHVLLARYSISLAPSFGMSALAVGCGIVVCYGTAMVDKLNRLLSIGLVITYALLITSAFPRVDPILLAHSHPAHLSALLPLLMTAFGFSMIVPTLSNYLHQEAKSLVVSVVIGSMLPLVVYILWEMVTLGTIPLTGPYGFTALAANHDNGTGVALALEAILHNPAISSYVRFFSIFAILTSFLGVSMSLFHFIADSGHWPINAKTRLPLLGLTFGPPLTVVLFYPYGFDTILAFAGIFVSLLFGIIPILMLWKGRTAPTTPPSRFVVPGGKLTLLLSALFFFWVIYQAIF